VGLLELRDLHVALEDGTEIVKGVDLRVDQDEIHAVMGPNGSGKSTLAYALMGHPGYQITGGRIEFVGPQMGAVVITHYQRILNYVEPDFVHVFVDGRIVQEGGPELAHKLEAEGYEAFGADERRNGSSS